MRQDFRKKRALITGASGGIGADISRELARHGCEVFLTGRDVEKLQLLSEELQDACSGYCPCDLTKLDEIDNLVKESGEIDILVNSAGYFVVGPLENMSQKDFQDSFDINVRAPFLLSQHLVQGMKRRKWGRIINIGSSSSYHGYENTSLYCASKHALLGMSRSFYNEFKTHNIKVFCFSPGSVKTEMGKKVVNQLYETFIDPKELAEYIVFSVSFDSDMITEEVRINRQRTQ